MAGTNNTIATRLTLDGEKEFKRGISSINQELRLSNAQLKEVAATYDLNGNAQERLAARSRILRDQWNAQNRIVEQYEERMRQAKQATDLSAEGLRGYGIQLTNARTKAKQLEKELADADRELEEFGRDSRRAGDQLENNLGEAAEETENKLQRLARSVEDSLGGMKKLQRISVAVDIVRGAWDVGESIANYVQSATENGMRKAMVQYNITAAGGNLATSMPLANQYAAIFGDRESAYEAVANLVAAGYTDLSLANMGRYVGGAAIKFQDTLKIESLADSIQESLAQGKLTGQVAELVNRLSADTGITEEQVNAQLAEAKLQGNEKIALEAYLRIAGLDTYYDDFVKQNEALVESAMALQEFNTALNNLAVTTLPLLTPAITTLTDAITTAAGLVEKAVSWIEEKFPGVENYDKNKTELKTVVAGEIRKRLEMKGLAPETAELLATTAPESIEKSAEIMGAIFNSTTGGVTGRHWTGFLADEVVNLVSSFFRPENAGAESEVEGLKPNAEMSPYVTFYRDTAADYQQAEARNKEMRNRLRNAGIVAAPAIESNYGEGVLEGWDGSQWTVVEDVETKLTEAAEAAETGGQNVGGSLITGLQSKSAQLMAIAEQQRVMLERVWQDPITPTVVVGYQMSGPVNRDLPALTVNLQGQDVVLDKRKVGSIVGQSINVGWGALLNGATK